MRPQRRAPCPYDMPRTRGSTRRAGGGLLDGGRLVSPGQSLRLVIQVEDVQTKRRGRLVFSRSPVHLGRSELNDLVLPVPSVSLWHGVLRFDAAGIHYVDTGSRNGTEVAGVAVKEGQSNVVPPRQGMVIWPLHFKFLIGDELEVGAIDNAAQLQQLFGEAQQVDTPAVPGQTRFVPALLQEQLSQVAPEADGAATILGLKEDEPRRPKTGSVPKRLPGDSTVIVPAPVIASSPPERAAPQERAATHERAAPGALFMALDEAYGQLQSSLFSVQRQLSNVLTGRSEAERRVLLNEIASKYPRLSDLNLLGSSRPKPSSGSSPGGGASDTPIPPQVRSVDFGTRLVNQFAGSYVAHRPRLDTEPRMERFLDRVAQVLESFAKGFIELRRGHESFGEQMGVGEVARRASRINVIDSIPRLLEFLLDESQSDERVSELTRGFADVMVHQVALVGGVREGVREVLNQISPEVVDQLARRKGGGLIDAVVPAQKRWALFTEHYRDLMNDEERLTQALFGKAFARAYALVANGGADPGEDE